MLAGPVARRSFPLFSISATMCSQPFPRRSPCFRCRFPGFSLGWWALTAAAVAAQEPSPAVAEPQPLVKQSVATLPDASRPPVVTEHAISVAGRELAYKAEVGMLPLLKEDGTHEANIFFVAYTLVTDADAARRPIMFCFNGGPGASAVWLHLGGLGPRRAAVNADGSLPPPPFELIDNDQTILPATDLVFIDPVATGYSRAVQGQKPEQFFGKEPDIEAMAEFIRLYTTRQARWRSPKYLCGESYGVFRVAGLAAELQDADGMFFNGLVLVSGLVDYGTIRAGDSNDLPYALFLPSYTAVAHHHGRLPPDLQADRAGALAEAEAFAAGEYWTALYAGSGLEPERRAAVAARLARYTGLSERLILDLNLRIDAARFREELLAEKRLVLGRFDGRITGRDGDRVSGMPRFDPSYDAALGPLAAAMNAYVREELKFETDLPYKVLTGVGPWPQDQNRYASTAGQLADAMSRNPHLRVLVQTGRCDLAVPYLSLRHSIDHLRIDPDVRPHVEYAEYDSGHMMYLNRPDLGRMADDLRRFLSQEPDTARSGP
jgi:carboxypeptidase C (cathepsin A)